MTLIDILLNTTFLILVLYIIVFLYIINFFSFYQHKKDEYIKLLNLILSIVLFTEFTFVIILRKEIIEIIHSSDI